MKKNLLILILTAALLPVAASAQNIKFEEYDLDNGLHVILSQNHKTPNVVVSVMYHVGSKNEEPHLTGFAHFFEHLMFEGTENIPRHTYDQYVTDAGGSLNANTSFDRTYYYEKLPSNYLELGLWLESERMLHPKIEEIGVATQKDVVCQEMGQTRDNQPYGSALYEIFTNSYKVHPYNHDVIGSEEHVRNASIEDFKNFHDMFYVPDNAVLTIVGDFDMDQAKEWVEAYFADIPKGTMPIRRPEPGIEPRRTAPVKDTVYDNIQMPMLIEVYPAPAYGTEDYFSMVVFNAILSSGNSSRFQTGIVDGKQTALMAASSMIPLEHPGLFMTQAFPNNVDLSVLEADVDSVIYGLLEEGISDREFQKVMNMVETSVALSNNTIEGVAEELATAYTYFKNTDFVNEAHNAYAGITKEQVIEVAKKYIDPAQKISIYYLPKQN
ncbi:MAG TPA: insulinase family protein [Candidatus Coprenecus pullistercoris]|nr:insulinase family protein [Candidatus Coprenecus pullistercoris]